MSLRDGQGLVTWEGGLFDPNDPASADLWARVRWAFAGIRGEGGRIVLNEAGRPVGERRDMFVTSPHLTSLGVSTLWYQWGRHRRDPKEVPVATYPPYYLAGTQPSTHTDGLAVDVNSPTPRDQALRAKWFGAAGLSQTIASEAWHWAVTGPWTNPDTAGSVTRPLEPVPEEDEMNVFLMTCEAVAGAGDSRGLRRFLVNPWEKCKREISSEEETLYRGAGVKQIVGLQPKAYGDLFRTVS